MNLRNVSAIYRKDLFDAIKDARVLLVLVIPFGIAIVYSFIFDDEIPIPEGTLAYTDVGSEVPERVQAVLGGTVDLDLEPFNTAAEVEHVMEQEEATIGLIIPEGFDEALRAGETPSMQILIPDAPGVTASTLTSVVEATVRDMAGSPQPAMLIPSIVQPDTSDPSLFDDLGLRLYFILAAFMMLIGMTSMLAVPIILAEEAEKKTLEALTLIASYLDVVVAKALVGITYVSIGTALLLGLTQIWPEDPLIFFSGTLLLSVALIGLGLLLGGLFRSASQLNNWGGLILMPVIAPAFIIGVWDPGIVRYVIEAIPVAQGMKLAVNGMSGETIFANIWLSYAILAGWAVIAYAALVWRLSRLRG
jgi:ABC-type multidrug transport system permease subunit